MQIRTFLRIMADSLFINNPFCRTIIALVNFCKEQCGIMNNELKFSKKMPLTHAQGNGAYQKRFIFDSTLKTGVDKN